MNKKLLLPCLRGAIGDWVTYTCLMRLSDINELISFADDIHKNKLLSKLIQRQLKEERAKEIGDYLLNDKKLFSTLLLLRFMKVSQNGINSTLSKIILLVWKILKHPIMH
jgi:DNA sulfur modification protein DndB